MDTSLVLQSTFTSDALRCEHKDLTTIYSTDTKGTLI